MNTVGPDGRTQYYRLTPAEVIEALKSHRMGLTNAEAKRRLERDGPNTLPSPALPIRGRGFRQALAIAAAATTTAGILAIYSGQPVVAGVLLLLATLHALAIQRLNIQLQLPTITHELGATRPQVLRNGSLVVLDDASQLVIGDIVHLAADDHVPADVRLLVADDLLVDERHLTGEHGYARKYVHALGSEVPAFARHNLAYCGSRVIAGDGYGIVTAIGAEMEIGLIQALAMVSAPAQGPLEKRVQNFAYGAAITSVMSTTVAIWLGWRMGLSSSSVTAIIITLLVALMPFAYLPLAVLITGRTKHLLTTLGVRVKGTYAIDHLRRFDILLLDTQAAAENTLHASRFMVGHTIYQVSGDGYAPTGTIASSQGKRLTKANVAELSLFFEAAALSHQTAVLAPGAEYAEWHVHGSHLEGALLTLARRAGLQTEKLRDIRAPLRTFHLDHHRHMASSVREYGDDRVAFVYGQPEMVLATCQKLWDHGHIRSISATDRTRFTHHRITALAEGMQTVALAYRIMPKRPANSGLTSDNVEEKLIFLGFVDVAQATHPYLQSALQAARAAGVKVSLLATNFHHGYAISGERLRKMTDAQVLERLRKGTATFTDLAPEDKIRLVRIVQTAGLHVALTGHSLADVPALLQADVGITLEHEPRAARGAATLHANSTASLFEAARIADEAAHTLDTLHKATCAATAGLATLAILSSVGAIFYLPMAMTAPRALALTLLVYPLLLVAVVSNNSRVPEEEPHEVRYRQKVALAFSLLAAGLAFTGFLISFCLQNLSPTHVALASRFSVEAGSLALAILVVCQLIDGTLGYTFTRLSPVKVAPLLLTLSAVAVLTYWPLAQRTLLLGAPSLAGWLVILGAAAIYAVIKLFERSTRQHARHTIIKLHHETFGRASSARI